MSLDLVKNPYMPGAGNIPAEFAGRDDLLKAAEVAFQRLQDGNHARSMMFIGLRGVGKTVLLNKLLVDAEERVIKTIAIQAHDNKSLAELLVPELRKIIAALSYREAAKDAVMKVRRALVGFMRGLKLSYEGVELSMEPQPGVADSGDIELDLPDLFKLLGQAAKASGETVALFVDEMQYLSSTDLSALIMAIHAIDQRQLPIILLGAALPQFQEKAGNSKSYAERIFDYRQLGPLSEQAAKQALERPAKRAGVTYNEPALDAILVITKDYAFYIQQWGSSIWHVAADTTITMSDVETATAHAQQMLDEGFFGVRFQRCAPSEQRYMRALAEYGPGAHKTGLVAKLLGSTTSKQSKIREALIAKGMIYVPARGVVEFTVPLFDQFMTRMMPTLE